MCMDVKMYTAIFFMVGSLWHTVASHKTTATTIL